MNAERWPDFVVIGAGKSGTTALNEYLDQHPEIFMAVKKEPNFFGLENVDPNSYEFEESRRYYFESVYKKDDYLALYTGATEDQRTGEISNLYLYSDEAYLNIKKYAPEAKLVALLRQPADRLYSRYLHMVREDAVPEQGWNELFNKETIWWRRPDLVNEGFYYRHLKKYFNTFPKENIKVYLYDEFRADPQRVLGEIFSFVGVDSKIIVDTDIVVNKSGRRKNDLFNMMLGQNGMLVNMLKVIMPGTHERMRRNKDVVKYLNKARNKHIVAEKMDDTLRNRITEEIYHDDIQDLGKLIGKDLTPWLKARPVKYGSAS